MSDVLTFRFKLEDFSDLEDGEVNYTPFYKFKSPNSHRVQGGVKVEGNKLRLNLILSPDPRDEERLVWPAELKWKILTNGKHESPEERQMTHTYPVDLDLMYDDNNWVETIDLDMETMKSSLDGDGSLTLLWHVALTIPPPRNKDADGTASHLAQKDLRESTARRIVGMVGPLKENEKQSEEEIIKDVSEAIKVHEKKARLLLQSSTPDKSVDEKCETGDESVSEKLQKSQKEDVTGKHGKTKEPAAVENDPNINYNMEPGGKGSNIIMIIINLYKELLAFCKQMSHHSKEAEQVYEKLRTFGDRVSTIILRDYMGKKIDMETNIFYYPKEYVINR